MVVVNLKVVPREVTAVGSDRRRLSGALTWFRQPELFLRAFAVALTLTRVECL